MHDATRLGIEGIAPVHGCAVIPKHEITHRPPVAIDRAFYICPDLIEQALRFGKL
jgi:hypothetical protein